MTLGAPLVITVGGVYLALLFLVAFLTDRLAEQGRARFLASPIVYTLSLAVYCTSWTFFGAVGTASRSGMEFVTIYIGPTLALMTAWLFLPKMVRIAKAQRITSIADFMSARYGKSRAVAVLVTVIALASITPYIALQLIAVRRSFVVLSGGAADGAGNGVLGRGGDGVLRHRLRHTPGERGREPAGHRRRDRVRSPSSSWRRCWRSRCSPRWC